LTINAYSNRRFEAGNVTGWIASCEQITLRHPSKRTEIVRELKPGSRQISIQPSGNQDRIYRSLLDARSQSGTAFAFAFAFAIAFSRNS
jgi:hypothetical protein